MSKTKPPKISILVPIYNTERYLAASLRSLTEQTLSDIEILCLDDGSTDGSPQILQEFAARDPRVRIVTKPNTGYGDTMNQGIKAAQGEYLAILEPDDYLAPSALETLYGLAVTHQADLVKANFYHLTGTSLKPTRHICPRMTRRPIEPRRDAKQLSPTYRELFTFPPAIWSALYRRDFLVENGISFLPTPGASYQDLGFNFKVLALARRIVLTTDAFVHYRLDSVGSSTNNPGKVRCVVTEYASIRDFLAEHQRLDQLAPAMTASKFRNYYWNWQRLAPEFAPEFLEIMYQELLQAKAAGWVQRAYFSISHWLALQVLLHCPQLFARIFRKN